MSRPMEARGLTEAQAQAALAEHGPNRIEAGDRDGLLEELLESLREPLVLLLLAIGGLYFLFGELRDALIILGVIITVALTEATIEWRAGRAVAALADLAEPKAMVWRDDALREIDAELLVPGDVVELRSGSRVPADARLIEAAEFATDESLITGESQPVERSVDPETSELHGGSAVVRGRGRAIVLRTGANSTLGKIAELVAKTKEPKTPLQRRMGELAKTLLWVALAVSALIPTVGVILGRPAKEMLLTGLSLAFATIPEELPVLIVVVLGLGSLSLARHGAIIRRLLAAETLGAVTIVCTDKTGTLTENRMTLSRSLSAADLAGAGARAQTEPDAILRAALLASDVEAPDPVDRAVNAAAAAAGLTLAPTQSYPFERSVRLASGYLQPGDTLEAGVKGAPEALIGRCVSWRDGNLVRPLDEAKRRGFLGLAAAAGEEGRVLGVGSRRLAQRPATRSDLEHDLVFEGVIVLRDPVRPEAAEAIRALIGAGVQITMITGDQASTAKLVAGEAGLAARHTLTGDMLAGLSDEDLVRQALEGAVIARVQPSDKLRIVEALGKAGQVVMVTGDGVNDAPALRAAAVGVAMGRVGSDVARQAAQVVLTNDSFATLVAAVREGRRLFDNFSKAIRYYLAVKVALVLIMATAAVLGLPLPFTPVQIVILELFMDLGASLAFVSQPAEGDLMRRPPRDPDEPFLNRAMLLGLTAGAVTLAVLVFGSFWWAQQRYAAPGARTVALVAWLVGHGALGFAMAGGLRAGGLRGLGRNPVLLAWLLAVAAFAALLVVWPGVQTTIGVGAVRPRDAVTVAALALLAPLWLLALRSRARDTRPIVAEPT